MRHLPDGLAFEGSTAFYEWAGGEAIPSDAPSGGEADGTLARVLADLGIDAAAHAEAVRLARAHGSDAASELVAAGLVGEEAYARAVAARLNVRFEAIGPQDRIVGLEAPLPGHPGPRLLRTCGPRLVPKAFCLPHLESIEALAACLRTRPRMAEMVRVTTLTDLRAALARQSEGERSRAASLGLSADAPLASARSVLQPVQAFAAAALLAAILAGLLAAPAAVLLSAHACLSLAFSACVALRLAAAVDSRPPAGAEPLPPPGRWPIYSVLVALHREADVVERLVRELDRLEWPKTRLDIKLICEADDPDTIQAAVAAVDGRMHFEIVRVPPSLPRTKPKALNFALPTARGAFVTILDAEDRPDPAQLLAAHAAFRAGDERLACVQAPLVIDNGNRSWLSGLFALEYAALFRGLLPFLARRDLPIPLGGTSNHFRRAALQAAGGWDSHNVTEDADLGMRLARAGFRIGTIDRPTIEDAPETWLVWRNQRTRWMKGWMQTALVHMRAPRRLWRDLGPRRFAVFQILFLGMILSALAQPVFMLTAGFALAELWQGRDLGPARAALLSLDLFNIVGGPAAFALLAWRAAGPSERRGFALRLASLHAYWTLTGLATFRALRQLLSDPHLWEKTPHGAEARRPEAGSARSG